MKLNDKLLEHVTYWANRARSEGYEDVAAWMGKMMHHQIVEERPHRKRGLKVRLAKNMREIVIDADKVKKARETEKTR